MTKLLVAIKVTLDNSKQLFWLGLFGSIVKGSKKTSRPSFRFRHEFLFSCVIRMFKQSIWNENIVENSIKLNINFDLSNAFSNPCSDVDTRVSSWYTWKKRFFSTRHKFYQDYLQLQFQKKPPQKPKLLHVNYRGERFWKPVLRCVTQKSEQQCLSLCFMHLNSFFSCILLSLTTYNCLFSNLNSCLSKWA